MLRLEHFNQLALRKLVNQPATGAELSAQVAKLVRSSIPYVSILFDLFYYCNSFILLFLYRSALRDEEMLEDRNVSQVLHWAAEEGRIQRLEQLVRPEMAFLWSQPQDLTGVVNKIDPIMARKLIEAVINKCLYSVNITWFILGTIMNKMIDWLQEGGDGAVDRTGASDFIKRLATDSNCKVSNVMKLMRSALSGLKEGPSVGEIIEILGRTVCIRRLHNSLKML